ncbi:MAG TPA: hypothetical protein VN833_05435, partial [Candidatus Acidoferrales bacterium]|nr:hypothetical protein [Candidatus Acidoferrales bacterium]
TTLLVNARQLDQGRAAKQVLQASTRSWAFISPQLSSFVTKCEQRKLTNSIGGGSLYGGRRALTTPALQDALFPILSPCRAVG